MEETFSLTCLIVYFTFLRVFLQLNRKWNQPKQRRNQSAQMFAVGYPLYQFALPLYSIVGSLMVLAWMVFASFSVLLPRYFKTAWPDKKPLGDALWFQVKNTKPRKFTSDTVTCTSL